MMIVYVLIHEAIDVFLQQFTENIGEGDWSVISRVR